MPGDTKLHKSMFDLKMWIKLLQPKIHTLITIFLNIIDPLKKKKKNFYNT